MLQARMHAMEEGRPYRFSIRPGKGGFRVAPDDSSYWTGGGSPEQGSEAPPLIIEEELPAGVQFAMGNGGAGGVRSGDWSTATTFSPDGSAADDLEITFEAEGTPPLVLNLRSLTGVITVRQKEPEGGHR
jgi:hypothetical protein